MPTMRPEFPRVITNSMRSDFTQCPRKFALKTINHWQPRASSVHLRAGKAFAKGMEVVRTQYFVEKQSVEDAILHGWVATALEYGEEPVNVATPKTASNMTSALLYYFNAFPLASDFLRPLQLHDGKWGIEFNFTQTLPIDHPDTGEPLVLGGRFDMLAEHQNGLVFVDDEKTATQLGASWVESWMLDSQVTEYIWAAKQFGYPVHGAIIRGVSILKNGHGHAQSIQYRTQKQLDMWYTQLLRDVKRMVALYQEGYFDYDLAGGCKSYGGCPYRSVCASPHPDLWLEQDFDQIPYHPYG